MVNVRIRKGKGVYGYRETPTSMVEPKRYESGAFLLDETKAARLIKRGIAERVPMEEGARCTELEGLTVKELTALAAAQEVDLPKNANKAQIIEILRAAEECADGNGDIEENPDDDLDDEDTEESESPM